MCNFVPIVVCSTTLSLLHLAVGMPSGPSLQSLGDYDLRALEGMERSNVEARIALLRNVQRLLDTAVAQLNQYSTVMATLG